jgi:SAM-dependent methyltransferase
MACPVCRNKQFINGAYRYHRLSFVQHSYRRLFPKKTKIESCSNCGHFWSDTPFTDVTKISLPEVFHHPQYNLDPSQVQTEKLYADQLINLLSKDFSGPLENVLDLRCLSGRLLAEARDNFSIKHCFGFDWHPLTCNWAKEQYHHVVTQYPIGDPVEFLGRWIDEKPQYHGQFQLIVQSQSILEFTRKPRAFIELVMRLLHPTGVWAIYEQLVDLFPREVFLHELFDPWAKQYFSTSSFQNLFSGSRLHVVKGFQSTTRQLCFVRPANGPYCPSALPVQDVLQKHGRFENHALDYSWQGSLGQIRARQRTALHKVGDRLSSLSLVGVSPDLKKLSRHRPASCSSRPIIDVLVVSCGRLAALQKTIKYFLTMCHSETHDFRFIIHDDWLEARADEHRQCRDWIKNIDLFSEIHLAEENRGISRSVNLLLSRVQSELYVHLEDDMVFIRPVNFDPLYRIFYKYSLVNQIRFNRTQTVPTLGSVSKIFGKYRGRMFSFDNTILTMASLWSNQAQIARANSPFTKLMSDVEGRFHERVFNLEFAKSWLDPFDAYTTLGAFMYGPMGSAKVVYEPGNFSAHSLSQVSFPEDNTLTIDRFRRRY